MNYNRDRRSPADLPPRNHNSLMSYTFLSKPPPPPQKQRPTISPPCIPTASSSSPASTPAATRRRSATLSSIAAWVSQIQPGSPAPFSPHRRLSLVNGADSPLSATITAQTPALHEYKGDLRLDLANQGYASFFVQLHQTPTTPASYKKDKLIAVALPIPPIPLTPSPQSKDKSNNRLRSLSFRSASAMLKRTHPRDIDAANAAKQTTPRSPIAKVSKHNNSGRARYAHIRPAPLVQDVALSQLLDGGTLNHNVKRVMDAQAKAAGMPAGSLGSGVADMHRDGAGGLWWDQDEEWEFAQLIEPPPLPTSAITPKKTKTNIFGFKKHPPTVTIAPCTNTNGASDDWIDFDDPAAEEERRGSVSSLDSDLDPRYAAGPADDDLAVFGGAVAMRTPGLSVLARRSGAKYMQKPTFVLDAFSPASPPAARAPLGPSDINHTHITDAESEHIRARGKARRRPAPLTLIPLSPQLQRPSNSPAVAIDARRDFLDDSFEPAVAPLPAVTTSMRTVKQKRSKLDVRGMFRVGGAKKD